MGGNILMWGGLLFLGALTWIGIKDPSPGALAAAYMGAIAGYLITAGYQLNEREGEERSARILEADRRWQQSIIDGSAGKSRQP